MVREQVCPDKPYAIGLRLGADAARKLRNPDELKIFQKWLDEKNCYVFTINGFPYGAFHGTRVKEQVYRPDWTTSDRLEYTILLFEILEALLQPGQEGSVSTLPGSFKEFISPDSIPDILFDHLLECSRSIEQLKKIQATRPPPWTGTGTTWTIRNLPGKYRFLPLSPAKGR